jgi:bacterioferritin-associated ferredoxin
MYVCICHAVTDREVTEALDAGADSLAAVSGATRAGSSCAMCHDTIEELVEERCGSCPLAGMRVA